MRNLFRSSLLLLFWVGLLVLMPITGQGSLDLDRIQRATVYVMQVQQRGDQLTTTCVGSGTIVDRRGLIVTNAHNTVPNVECPGDVLMIALSVDLDQPPVPTYRAEIAQFDAGLDLALLRITEELNGRLVEPDTLFLPFVEVTDSGQVLLDDTVTVVGYPEQGNDPIETVTGTVSGFVAEPSGGDRAWMKTTAAIPGSMTGGGVYDNAGRLVGVPTTVAVTEMTTANCTVFEDTNGDNLVNRNDRCIPVGDFFNALRPSNFVRPLLRSASLGLSVDKITAPASLQLVTDEPAFTNLLISPSVTNNGQPATVVRTLPTGTNSLYLFFDFQNMNSDTIYELRVSRDGTPDPTFSLAPVRWSGGRDGSWYIGSSGRVWPNGTYDFELFVDGRASGRETIQIGVPAPEASSFRNIAFGLESGDNLVGVGGILPAGTNIKARFVYQNMTPTTQWTIIWYYNDAEIPGSRTTETWGTPDTQTNLREIRLQAPGGFQPGRYRLELGIDGVLAARGDFVVAGADAGAIPRVFSDAYATAAESPQAALESASLDSLASSAQRLYTVFNWEQLSEGILWRMRWSVDDVVFYDQLTPWRGLPTGEGFITRLESVGDLPDGTYRMELLINGIILESVEVEVGIGQLPIDQFAQATGVQLNGRIVDAATGEGIPGISFILISEDYSIQDFTWDSEQVYATAVTDRNGRFQINRLLQYGSPYSVMIAADGYLQIDADGVVVDEESPNPTEITISLTR